MSFSFLLFAPLPSIVFALFPSPTHYPTTTTTTQQQQHNISYSNTRLFGVVGVDGVDVTSDWESPPPLDFINDIIDDDDEFDTSDITPPPLPPTTTNTSQQTPTTTTDSSSSSYPLPPPSPPSASHRSTQLPAGHRSPHGSVWARGGPRWFSAEWKSSGPIGFMFKWHVECIVAVLLVVVLVAGYVGKAANQDIVKAWLSVSRGVFDENFAKVGYRDSFLLMKGWSVYECVASGRKNCGVLVAKIHCVHRQCFWRSIVLRPLLDAEDVLTIYVQLDKLDTTVFAICRKRETKATLAAYADLKQYGRVRKVDGCPSSLTVMSDSAEAVEHFMQPKVLKALQAYERWVKLIRITDVASLEQPDMAVLSTAVVSPTTKTVEATGGGSKGNQAAPPKTLRLLEVQIRLPPKEDMMEIQGVIRMTMYLIDAAYYLQLSDKTRQTVRSCREAVERQQMKEQEEERVEQAEKKRQERKKVEEEKFEKMTPGQQRRYEEKQYKKELKQSKPKMKLLKM
eukprot:GHVS01090426.1.p1 GENE.GHVS01090426.1~~GHVS01090426.1.p1  ORF type:complete len:576 (-),score=147.76 GHVS01090426.1:196-1725(-)